MDIVVLGSGCGVPRADRAACSVLIRAGGINIVIDLGPGILRRLNEEGFDYQEIDAILLSHLHPDHTSDLWPYYLATRWAGFERAQEVALVASQGYEPLAQGLEAAYGHWVTPRPGLMDYRLLDPARPNRLEMAPGLVLLTGPVAHTPDSMALRLEAGGRAVVYSGDTGPTPHLSRLAQGADLLIIESSLPEGTDKTGHLTPSLAGRIGAEAGAKKVVLTHFFPEADQADPLTPAQKEYPGPLLAAYDGLRLEV